MSFPWTRTCYLCAKKCCSEGETPNSQFSWAGRITMESWPYMSVDCELCGQSTYRWWLIPPSNFALIKLQTVDNEIAEAVRL